jgi:hypothetical protein
MSASLFRAATLTIALLASTSCGAIRAIKRTPAVIEANTVVLRGVDSSKSR